MNRTLKKISVFVVCAMLLLSAVLCGGCTAGDDALANGTEPLTVTILKVGKADAIIIRNGDHTVLIDAGEEDDGEEVTEFLQQQGADRIDLMIITHFDKDHVGGADTVAEEIAVDQILLPDYEGTSTEYLDFMETVEAGGIPVRRLAEPYQVTIGDMDLLTEPPQSYDTNGVEGEFDNNFSLITTITHGENRLLFTGDIEKSRIREWLAGGTVQPCDFLKVPHHGIYNRATEELVKAVQPKYAVICSSEKNPAETNTLETLKAYGVDVLQTKDGDITVVSDGKKITMHQ
ncbi:MAG: MBL fold metallo-hydrolase [Eubacterium sp.]|nr:MBL fold metallo-hydrolase [Eubacterium sp.]